MSQAAPKLKPQAPSSPSKQSGTQPPGAGGDAKTDPPATPDANPDAANAAQASSEKPDALKDAQAQVEKEVPQGDPSKMAVPTSKEDKVEVPIYDDPGLKLAPLPKGARPEHVLASVQRQLEIYQDGGMRCVENGEAIRRIQVAIQHLRRRVTLRRMQHVFGTDKAHRGT